MQRHKTRVCAKISWKRANQRLQVRPWMRGLAAGRSCDPALWRCTRMAQTLVVCSCLVQPPPIACCSMEWKMKSSHKHFIRAQPKDSSTRRVNSPALFVWSLFIFYSGMSWKMYFHTVRWLKQKNTPVYFPTLSY